MKTFEDFIRHSSNSLKEEECLILFGGAGIETSDPQGNVLCGINAYKCHGSNGSDCDSNRGCPADPIIANNITTCPTHVGGCPANGARCPLSV